jgi:hypothetical protein
LAVAAGAAVAVARIGARGGFGAVFLGRGREAFEFAAGQGFAQGVFDGPDHGHVLAGDQGMGLSLAFGAAGATDAVGVGVGGVGDVEVDDVADLGDVDAPGGDVRGHQDPVGAGLEAVEGGLALALGQVAWMQAARRPDLHSISARDLALCLVRVNTMTESDLA